MDQFPSCDTKTLMDQASMTASTYLGEAVKTIDDTFGKGYAAKHPELVAAFLKTAAQDFHTAKLGHYIDAASQRIYDAILQRESV